jgi:hypothetical protein
MVGAAEKANTGKIKLKAPPYIYHGVTDKHGLNRGGTYRPGKEKNREALVQSEMEHNSNQCTQNKAVAYIHEK